MGGRRPRDHGSGSAPRRGRLVRCGADRPGRIVAGGAVHGLVRPVREVPAESIVIHGIRPADLARAPEPPQAFAPLLDATAGRVLVAHAAWVERGFLRRALRPMRMRPREPIIDTASLGRLLMHERDGVSPERLSLAALVDWLGLPAHRPHHALGDALTTAQAFLALAAHLDADRPQTIASLADADRRLSGLRTFHPRQSERNRPAGESRVKDRVRCDDVEDGGPSRPLISHTAGCRTVGSAPDVRITPNAPSGALQAADCDGRSLPAGRRVVSGSSVPRASATSACAAGAWGCPPRQALPRAALPRSRRPAMLRRRTASTGGTRDTGPPTPPHPASPCSNAPFTLASSALIRKRASASGDPKRRPGAASDPWWQSTQCRRASAALLVEQPAGARPRSSAGRSGGGRGAGPPRSARSRRRR